MAFFRCHVHISIDSKFTKKIWENISGNMTHENRPDKKDQNYQKEAFSDLH